ncbi:uncharacterized protein P884DRAFT_23638 [Thermothelomyces heterothallicus CBS 202.75]|uniref:uncharacterized protein n=1 Tax=Thermothelomyces heterothallicus CBS 202.75 TaxID=1149848 RepID=UPI003742509B
MAQTYKEGLSDAQLQVHLTTMMPSNKRATRLVVQRIKSGCEVQERRNLGRVAEQMPNKKYGWMGYAARDPFPARKLKWIGRPGFAKLFLPSKRRVDSEPPYGVEDASSGQHRFKRIDRIARNPCLV